MTTERVRWLDPAQQRSWRALLMGTTLLMDQLNTELEREFGLSMAEYDILVRLSERPDRQMRMAQLAEALCHSRSRVTHTVARMERASLVARSISPEDGRGVRAELTDQGYALLARAAPTHVMGVRQHLIDLVDADDLAALGRAMDAVTDQLIGKHPAMEIRSPLVD